MRSQVLRRCLVSPVVSYRSFQKNELGLQQSPLDITPSEANARVCECLLCRVDNPNATAIADIRAYPAFTNAILCKRREIEGWVVASFEMAPRLGSLHASASLSEGPFLGRPAHPRLHDTAEEPAMRLNLG